MSERKKTDMDKKLLIFGIVLLVLAALCFGLSFFFHYVHQSVLDGSNELYARLYRRYLVFLFVGIGFAVSGVIVILIRLLKKW